MSFSFLFFKSKMRNYIYLSILLITLFAGCSREERQHNQLQKSEMILIPAGSFMMGEDSTYSLSNQKPVHEVYLDAYYIDKTEVTVAQFKEFIRDGGYKKKEFWTKEGWEFIRKASPWEKKPLFLNRTGFDKPSQPASGVNWYEADAYCRWCGKRLPTEAEWERASRGLDGRIYPWGNEMDYTKLYYVLSGTYRVGRVGSYPAGASPDGVLDMAGRLWEWTSDWYKETYYSKSLKENPKGPKREVEKVLRGGSWGSNRLQWKSTYRYSERPERRRFDIGFRCVCDKH